MVLGFEYFVDSNFSLGFNLLNMKYLILIIAFISLTYTSIVFANGFGVTLDKVVGDYTANVDYDALSGIFTGQPVQFAFQLFNKNRSQAVDFTNIWVNITPMETNKDNGYTPPIFDGGIIRPGFSPAGMAFTFLAAGTYDLKLRFDNGDKTLAEATFPLTVEGGEGKTLVVNSNSTRNFLEGGLIGLILGPIAVWFFKRET